MIDAAHPGQPGNTTSLKENQGVNQKGYYF